MLFLSALACAAACGGTGDTGSTGTGGTGDSGGAGTGGTGDSGGIGTGGGTGTGTGGSGAVNSSGGDDSGAGGLSASGGMSLGGLGGLGELGGGFSAGGQASSGGTSAAGGSGGTEIGDGVCGGLGGAGPMSPDTSWTVQFGTSETDEARNVAVDCNGDIYIVGQSFGVLGENLENNLGDLDVFVRKLSGQDGTTMWTRQFGTATEDRAYGVAVDSEGNVLIGGTYQGTSVGETGGWGDVFVAKLSGKTGEEIWKKQLATVETDFAWHLVVDADDNAIVAGYMGTTNWDAFVRKVSGEDGSVIWEQRFGTDASDISHTVTTEAGGDVFVVGETDGDLGGEGSAGETDTFIRRLNGDTGAEIWTVQFGSDKPDRGHGIALTLDGQIVVGGYVSSSGTVDGYPSAGSNDGFARKVSAEDGTEIWTHQWGTAESEEVWNVKVDSSGRVFASGRTYGDLGGVQAGAGDHYILELDPASGSTLDVLQMGTPLADVAQMLTFDAADHLIAVGFTLGAFPDYESEGSWDVYVTKMAR